MPVMVPEQGLRNGGLVGCLNNFRPIKGSTNKTLQAFPGATATTLLFVFVGTLTITKEAAEAGAPFPAKEMWRVIAPNTEGVALQFNGTVGNLNQHTASFWYRRVVAGGGTQWQLAHSGIATGTPLLSDVWERAEFTFIPTTTGNALALRKTATTGDEILIQACQTEESAFATPLIETNGAAASRVASRLPYSVF